MRIFTILVVALALGNHHIAAAQSCVADNETFVAANDECLAIRAYGERAEQTSLVVLIHGDGYRGGPSDYLYRNARALGSEGVVAVGLIRPGYYDSEGNQSTGNSHRDGDNYQIDVIETVAAAIKELKSHYEAEHVILVGHSGGSAISGVILGKYPDLANAALLSACPCNVPEWRTMRRGYNNWTLSLSPHDFIDAIDQKTNVVTITGGDDDNTVSVLGRDYADTLKTNGLNARHVEVSGIGHDGIVKTQEFMSEILRLLENHP